MSNFIKQNWKVLIVMAVLIIIAVMFFRGSGVSTTSNPTTVNKASTNVPAPTPGISVTFYDKDGKLISSSGGK